MVRSKRSRGWVFTLFSYAANEVIRLRELGRSGLESTKYVVFGRERCPQTGRRHLQGYIYFSAKKTMVSVKRCLGDGFGHAHLEIANGTAVQNREYCTKEGDYEEFGQLPSQGRRSDLLKIKVDIERGISEEKIAGDNFGLWVQYRRSFAAYRDLLHRPQMRVELKVYVLIGDAGVGKTRFAYEYAKEIGSGLYRSPDPELRWFDGYREEQVVLLDDYRGGGTFGFLLQLLDIYPLRVPVKGSFIWWQPQVIFITSNDSPDFWFPDKDQAPLLRRFTRVVNVSSGDNLSWRERYGRLKTKLNIE